LPVQRLDAFAAQPLGAPLTDVQALIGPADLEINLGALCRDLRVVRLDFSAMVGHQRAFMGGFRGQSGSWVADVRGGAGAYLERLKAARSGDAIRQADKKRRKFERERGVCAFVARDRNRERFDALLAWKIDQCRRTAQPPIWATHWVRSVLDTLWDNAEAECAPALFTLTLDGQLVAANFFLTGRGVLADWIIAHDDAFASYSPGAQLVRRVCEWAGDQGVDAVDLGPGDYQYKRLLTTDRAPLAWGYAGGRSVSSGMRGAFYALRSAAEARKLGAVSALPGKLMRRIDVCRGLGAPLWAR
jgi:CelD/BcsL family acetyltransferase involved in cellulose biosynthesis